MSKARISMGLISLVALAGFAACKMHPPEPESTAQEEEPAARESETKSEKNEAKASSPATSATGESDGFVPTQTRPRKVHAKPTGTARISPDDPLHGEFSLESALAGLPGSGPPRAEIATSMGKLECELYDDKAPLTVANFVGLARGTRTWKNPDKEWVKTPAYDGTTFHRIIKGFMIQGGDAEGTGKGEAGYVIPDEVWEDAYHDQRGLLCMANRGPNTNSAQFFILDAAAPHLDKGYTIFGKCGPDEVIEKLATVPVSGDKPDDPPKIKKIRIVRGPAKSSGDAGSAAKKSATPAAPTPAAPTPAAPTPAAPAPSTP
jgi:peptidyl-prolyl cis-trans isomerase A (cyclophilin A)